MDIGLAALVWAEMVSAGIVPIDSKITSLSKQVQIEKIINDLNDDDKRRLKRKFRKIWRQIMRNTKNYSLVAGEPSVRQMKARKLAVFYKFYNAAEDLKWLAKPSTRSTS